METVLVLAACGVLPWAAYQSWLMLFRPEEYEARRRRRYEWAGRRVGSFIKGIFKS
jgi:hypothetical protein